MTDTATEMPMIAPCVKELDFSMSLVASGSLVVEFDATYTLKLKYLHIS